MGQKTNRLLAYDAIKTEMTKMTLNEGLDFIFSDTISRCKNERYLNYLLKNFSINSNTAFLYFGIQDFENIISTYGFDFAYKVLSKSANFLLSYFRTSDEVIRCGNSFVVIVYDICIEDLISRVLDALAAISEIKFSTHDDFSIKMSAGCSYFNTFDESMIAQSVACFNSAVKDNHRLVIEEKMKTNFRTIKV